MCLLKCDQFVPRVANSIMKHTRDLVPSMFPSDVSVVAFMSPLHAALLRCVIRFCCLVIINAMVEFDTDCDFQSQEVYWTHGGPNSV